MGTPKRQPADDYKDRGRLNYLVKCQKKGWFAIRRSNVK